MVLFLHGNLVACHMMNYLGNGLRQGLKAHDNGDVELSMNAMRLDATRELAARKMQLS